MAIICERKNANAFHICRINLEKPPGEGRVSERLEHDGSTLHPIEDFTVETICARWGEGVYRAMLWTVLPDKRRISQGKVKTFRAGAGGALEWIDTNGGTAATARRYCNVAPSPAPSTVSVRIQEPEPTPDPYASDTPAEPAPDVPTAPARIISRFFPPEVCDTLSDLRGDQAVALLLFAEERVRSRDQRAEDLRTSATFATFERLSARAQAEEARRAEAHEAERVRAFQLHQREYELRASGRAAGHLEGQLAEIQAALDAAEERAERAEERAQALASSTDDDSGITAQMLPVLLNTGMAWLQSPEGQRTATELLGKLGKHLGPMLTSLASNVTSPAAPTLNGGDNGNH